MRQADSLPWSGTVVAVVPDLIFASRIVSLVERLGSVARVITTPADLASLLAESRPGLVLVDLAARGIDPMEVIRLAKEAQVPRIVAFGPHLDREKRAAALAAGADRWVTNQRLLEALQAELMRPRLPDASGGRGEESSITSLRRDAERSCDPSGA